LKEEEAIRMLLDNYPPREELLLQKAFDLAINSLRFKSDILSDKEALASNTYSYCLYGGPLTHLKV